METGNISRFGASLLAVVLTLLTVGIARATTPIIDVAEVKAAIARGAIVWDVRGTPAYRKAHIPGAISIGDAGTVLRNPVSEDFIDVARIEKIFGDAGLDPSKEIVVYADRGSAFAYFGRFTMRYFGAGNVSVFHDGIDGWIAAGEATESTDSARPPLAVKLTPQPLLSVGTDDVVARVKAGSAQILDVRTVAENEGNDVRAIRGGHIPGAISIPYEKNWQDPDTQGKLARKLVADNSGAKLAPIDALKSLYAKLDPAKETVVYCQSGVRASETAAVLESLGYRNVKVYDSSWLGYAAKLDAPVERETFFNVGALNGKLAAMQKRIDELEQMLKQSLTVAPLAEAKR
jgi:thiosulfate/3-mercaptopyruvate sulfurtransferase